MPNSRKGIPNKVTAAAKAETASWFKRILNDEKEAQHWAVFLSGAQTNIIAWQAFKRAVEYKRGMPVQPQEHSGPEGEPFRVIVEHIGTQDKAPAKAD